MIVRLVALSRAAYWITILYACALFATCHVTAALELASAQEKYEGEHNGTDVAQPSSARWAYVQRLMWKVYKKA